MFSIVNFHFLDVFPCQNYRFCTIWLNFDRRTPFHCRFLAPESRYRSSCLNIACYFHTLARFVLSEYVFSFNEIGNISLSVDASYNKSSTWSSAIFLGNQSKIKFLVSINLNCLNVEITIDTRNFEGSILKMIKVL